MERKNPLSEEETSTRTRIRMGGPVGVSGSGEKSAASAAGYLQRYIKIGRGGQGGHRAAPFTISTTGKSTMMLLFSEHLHHLELSQTRNVMMYQVCASRFLPNHSPNPRDLSQLSDDQMMAWHDLFNIVCTPLYCCLSGHLFCVLSSDHMVRLGQEASDDSGLCPGCTH